MTGLASQIISFIIRIAGDKLIIALFFDFGYFFEGDFSKEDHKPAGTE